MTLTHANDSDLEKLKVAQIFKRVDIICYEETSGELEESAVVKKSLTTAKDNKKLSFKSKFHFE